MIRVQSMMAGGQRDGWDLTDAIEGLVWSSVNPGGDERCSFVYRRSSWWDTTRHIEKGNGLVVFDGTKVLWSGRIDEHDPDIGETDQVGVVAYGRGIVLKDQRMREIYVDRDLTRWTSPSVARRLALTPSFQVQAHTVTPDSTTGQPSLALPIQGPWSATFRGLSEALYDAQGIPIGSLYYAWKRGVNVSNADVNWSWNATLAATDPGGSPDSTPNLLAAGPGTGTLLATAATKVFALVNIFYGAVASASNAVFELYWTVLAVYGNHGLTKRGVASTTAAQGVWGSDVAKDVCSRSGGLVQARLIADSAFVIPQLVFFESTTLEDVITEVSKLESVNWGVWGPNSVFDDLSIGYLDYQVRDDSTRDWAAWRSDFDKVNLHVELATAYNAVDVSYNDVTGSGRVVRRTLPSQALDNAGITQRTATISAGATTLEGAQALGDTFLALQAAGGAAPVRGTVEISKPMRWKSSQDLPCHHIRANGENLYIPDAMPDREMFQLGATLADRRGIFPVKRVEVDASGEKIKTRIELDQTNDLLSILLARLQIAGVVAGG